MKKEFFKYVTSNYLSVILNILRTVALAKIVVPEIVGIWSIINTFAGYFRYNNLGLNSLAYYRAKRKKSESLYSNLLLKTNLSLAIGLGIIYSCFFIVTQYSIINKEMNWGLLLLLFFITITGVQLSETYTSINKLNSNFKIISFNTNLFSLLQFGLVLMGAFWAGLSGIILGNSIAIIISFLYLVKTTEYKKYSINLNFSRLVRLFKGSVSTIVPGFLYIAFVTLDVFFIKEKFGLSENGFYAIVLTLINVILIAPSSLAVFLYSKNPNHLIGSKKYVYKITVINFLVCYSLVFISYIFLFFLTKNFLFKYSRSLEIFILLSYSIPFLSIKNVIVDILIATSKQHLYNTLLLITVILKIMVLFFLTGDKFYGVIAGFNIFFGLMTLTLYYFIGNEKYTSLIRRYKMI